MTTEHGAEESLRSEAEIVAAEKEIFDRRWYAVDCDIEARAVAEQGLLSAEAATATRKGQERIERLYGKESLTPADDYERGVLDGKHMALRWMLGMDWDEAGILDT
jgi:hypothetical protein